jgi:hypothetical protein
MKSKIIAIACLAIAATCATRAEMPLSAPWVGVWQGMLDGQPGVTLTLARDTGQLSGTLVLNIIKREESGGAHVSLTEPHTLVNPQVDGNVLSFGVKKIDGSGDLFIFTVVLAPNGRARIHCVNCGKEAPIVDMEKQ